MSKQPNAPRTPPASREPERLVTIRQACERLTLSRTTVYRLGLSGALPVVRLTPSRAAIREADLNAFVAARTEARG